MSDNIQELKDLLLRIKFGIKNYDTEKNGYLVAKDFSAHIALLCHDTANGSGMLKQFFLQDTINFLSSASSGIGVNGINTRSLFLKFVDSNNNAIASFCDCELNGKNILNIEYDGAAKAYLVSVFRDESFPKVTKFISFQDWWIDEKVIKYGNKEYSRQQIIKLVRNKDSGVHKEKNINDKEYQDLKTLNSLYNYTSKWSFNLNCRPIQIEYSGVYEVVRSIASEVVVSIEKYLKEII